MLRHNEKDASIEIIETLTFDHTVKPIFDQMIENFEADYSDSEDETAKRLMAFIKKIKKGITLEEKNEILNMIIEEYTFWDFDSIFDEDFISDVIHDWVDNKIDNV